MPVDSIGHVASPEVDLQQNMVGIEDFLEIFLAQLNFQDPLEPVDNREFIAQLAQFSALQISNESNSHVEQLLEVQSVNQSLGLIGKSVEVVTETGQRVIGEVSTIRFGSSGNPLLTIKVGDDSFITDISPARVTLVR